MQPCFTHMRSASLERTIFESKSITVANNTNNNNIRNELSETTTSIQAVDSPLWQWRVENLSSEREPSKLDRDTRAKTSPTLDAHDISPSRGRRYSLRTPKSAGRLGLPKSVRHSTADSSKAPNSEPRLRRSFARTELKEAGQISPPTNCFQHVRQLYRPRKSYLNAVENNNKCPSPRQSCGLAKHTVAYNNELGFSPLRLPDIVSCNVVPNGAAKPARSLTPVSYANASHSSEQASSSETSKTDNDMREPLVIAYIGQCSLTSKQLETREDATSQSHQFHTNGMTSACIDDLFELYHDLDLISAADLVAVDAGSRDLFENPCLSPMYLAHKLHDVARSLQRKHNVQRVVLLEAIPFTNQGNEKVNHIELFNAELNNLCLKSKGVCVLKHTFPDSTNYNFDELSPSEVELYAESVRCAIEQASKGLEPAQNQIHQKDPEIELPSFLLNL